MGGGLRGGQASGLEGGCHFFYLEFIDYARARMRARWSIFPAGALHVSQDLVTRGEVGQGRGIGRHTAPGEALDCEKRDDDGHKADQGISAPIAVDSRSVRMRSP